MIVYEARCSKCGRVFPTVFTDPSMVPVCCRVKMDAIPYEQEEHRKAVIKSLGFYDN